MWRNCQGTDTGRNTALPLQKCRPDTNSRGERSEVEFGCFKSLDESSCSSELLQLIPELLIFLTFNWRISLSVTNFFRFVDLPICSDKRGVTTVDPKFSKRIPRVPASAFTLRPTGKPRLKNRGRGSPQ